MTHEDAMQGIRIPAHRLVETLMRALCLRYGCTQEEAETIRANPAGAGIHPCLASVRAGDGREVYRFDSIQDLDRMVRCEASCRYLAKAVRLSCR